jgi:pectate lyase
MSRTTLAFSLVVMSMYACGGDDGPTQDDTSSTGDVPTTSTTAPTSTSTEPSTSATTVGTDDPSTTVSTSETTDDPTMADTTTGDPPSGEYEGFGAVTRGHEDCPDRWTTYEVTSLADDGTPGTLRDAIAEGCRLVTFTMGGTITLESTLNIRYGFVTIDGASAPDPGITIVQPAGIATTIEAGNSSGPVSDVIIHHLRMVGATVEEEGADIWGIDGEANPVSRIIIDHVTASGGQDGIFDLWSDVDDVTLSWNLMIDTAKMMHLSTNDLALTRDRVSIHHNVFARNNERQIRIRHHSEQIDYVNNVVWGWGFFEGGAAGLHVAYDEGEVNPSLNVVGNVFQFVEGLDGDPGDAIIWETGASVGTIFFDDNLVPKDEMDGVSNGDAQVIPAEAQVTTYGAATLAENVVPWAGTHYPTEGEVALLDEIAAGI